MTALATPEDDHLWLIEAAQEIREGQRAEDRAAADALMPTAAYKLLTQELNIARTSHLFTPDDTAELLVEQLDGSIGWNPDADTRPHFGFMYHGDDGLWRRCLHYQEIGPTHIDPAMQRLIDITVSKAFLNLAHDNKHLAKNLVAVEATAKSLQHRASHFKRTLLSAKQHVSVSQIERRAHFAMWFLNYGRDSDLADFRADYRADGYAGGLLDREVNPLLYKAGVTYREGTVMAVNPARGEETLQAWVTEYQQCK